MGKSKEIPIEVRSQIIALYNHTSKSHRQIETVIEVSHSSVSFKTSKRSAKIIIKLRKIVN